MFEHSIIGFVVSRHPARARYDLDVLGPSMGVGLAPLASASASATCPACEATAACRTSIILRIHILAGSSTAW
jgi:hypothetical protein